MNAMSAGVTCSAAMIRSPSFSRSSSSTTMTIPPSAISCSACSTVSKSAPPSPGLSVVVTALLRAGTDTVSTAGLVGGHLVERGLHVLHEQLQLPDHALGRLLRPVVDQDDVLRRQLPPQFHVLLPHLVRRAHDPQTGVDHRVHPVGRVELHRGRTGV